jgi:hypothetical protein
MVSVWPVVRGPEGPRATVATRIAQTWRGVAPGVAISEFALAVTRAERPSGAITTAVIAVASRTFDLASVLRAWVRAWATVLTP